MRMILILTKITIITIIITIIIAIIIIVVCSIYNLTQHRMSRSKVRTDDSRLLQESNLAVRQPQGAISQSRRHVTRRRHSSVTEQCPKNKLIR